MPLEEADDIIPQGEPSAGAASAPVTEAEQLPQWAKDLRQQTAQLLEATRTAQGQSRRAEEVAAQVLARQQAEHPRQTEASAIAALVKDLDDSQPAERAIKLALLTMDQENRGLRQEVGQLSRHRQRQVMTESEMGERQYVIDVVTKDAQDMLDLGVPLDLAAYVARVQALPTDGMFQEAKRLLREQKKTHPQAAANEYAAAIRARGNYSEQRSAPGARPRSKVEMETAYGNGDIDTKEYEAWRRTHN